jgi:RNA polymerase sigma factor (sigma-70 family)
LQPQRGERKFSSAGYNRIVRRHSNPATPDTTAALIARAQAGDASATEALLEANRGLIWTWVNRYRAIAALHLLELDDLYSAGVVGFMGALKAYDPARGCRFSTLLTWCVKNAIVREIDRFSGTVRVPRDARSRGVEVPVLSLDWVCGEGADAATLAELLPAPGDVAEEVTARVVVGDALATLEDRERFVLVATVVEQWSAAEVGVAIERGAEAVGLIKVGALGRLREHLTAA